MSLDCPHRPISLRQTRFAYDGLDIIADYNQNNAMQHRYVFGPGSDAPIVEYAGTGTSNRTFLTANRSF